ncbi:hypothetical protein O9992_18210 [Vibrio lentus]|nr:hypothetical protein [Vibrio lentus]
MTDGSNCAAAWDAETVYVEGKFPHRRRKFQHSGIDLVHSVAKSRTTID